MFFFIPKKFFGKTTFFRVIHDPRKVDLRQKNSNIIIEELFWKRKDYFSWKKFETQKSNFINKFYFCPNCFSYRFLPNFKEFRDSNESWIIFSEKRFSTTSPFPIFENKFFNSRNHKKKNFQNKIFIYKLLNLIIICYHFQKLLMVKL